MHEEENDLADEEEIGRCDIMAVANMHEEENQLTR